MELQTARNFVNRTNEVALAEKIVREALEDVPLKECVVNFYGMPGIGKSAFLAKVHQDYQQSGIFNVAINLETIANQSPVLSDLRSTKLLFLQELRKELGVRDSDMIVESDDKAIDQEMITIVDKIVDLDKRIILLIDSWEHAPDTMLAWVERSLLLPLVRKERLICFMSSQRELRWRQFEVRRRVCPYELPPLDPQATAEQVACAEEVKEHLFSITAGLPFANEITFRYSKDQQVSSEWIKEHRAHLAESIGSEVQQRVVGGMAPAIKEICEIMSLFR